MCDNHISMCDSYFRLLVTMGFDIWSDPAVQYVISYYVLLTYYIFRVITKITNIVQFDITIVV